MPEAAEPIPAATLVLMREKPGGAPELLMMERTGDMAFAAGALVFPGGRIDAEDRAAAAGFADFPDAAARIAAIRETIEETGIAPAILPPPDPPAARRLREGIEGGAPFDRLLAGAGLALDLAALTPFARWCPSFRETRRFDAFFFLAEAPAGVGQPSARAHEAERVFWAGAADTLAEIAAGRARAIFPTRRNLERLTRFGSIADARADAARHKVAKITPWIEDRDGEPHLCIPEGLGYPVTSEPLATARRM